MAGRWGKETATDWVQVTILDKKQGQWITQNVGSGDLMFVESRIPNSSYKRDGEQVYTTNIIAQLFNLVTKKAA